MKPGQTLQKWWMDMKAGRISGREVGRAARAERAPLHHSERFLSLPEDAVAWDAVERLKSDIFTTEGHLIRSMRADWQHADPRLMRWAALFVEYARRRGVPLYVHCCFRTALDQADLFARGRSKVEWPKSAHNIGEAVDIVHGVYHWDLTPGEWQTLHVLGRRCAERINATLKKEDKLILNWGGDEGPGDKFRWDPAHWEIATYRKRTRTLAVGTPVHVMPRAILQRVKW